MVSAFGIVCPYQLHSMHVYSNVIILLLFRLHKIFAGFFWYLFNIFSQLHCCYHYLLFLADYIHEFLVITLIRIRYSEYFFCIIWWFYTCIRAKMEENAGKRRIFESKVFCQFVHFSFEFECVSLPLCHFFLWFFLLFG